MPFPSIAALVEHYYSHPLPNHGSLCLQQPFGYTPPRWHSPPQPSWTDIFLSSYLFMHSLMASALFPLLAIAAYYSWSCTVHQPYGQVRLASKFANTDTQMWAAVGLNGFSGCGALSRLKSVPIKLSCIWFRKAGGYVTFHTFAQQPWNLRMCKPAQNKPFIKPPVISMVRWWYIMLHKMQQLLTVLVLNLHTKISEEKHTSLITQPFLYYFMFYTCTLLLVENAQM